MATAEAALDWLRANLGTAEYPDGSNHNFITEWAGLGDVAWCAETVSRALCEAGGDSDAWPFSGITPDYSWGFAYVPSLRRAFIEAGLYDQTPRVGDVVIFGWSAGSDGDHTGLVEQVVGDGTVVTLEGNQSNALVRMRRSMDVIIGFGHPPYDPEPAPTPERKDQPEMITYDIPTPDGNGQTYLLRSTGKPVFLARGTDVEALRARAHVPHAGEISVDLHNALLGQ